MELEVGDDFLWASVELTGDDSLRSSTGEERRQAENDVYQDIIRLGVWERRVVGTSAVLDRLFGMNDSLYTPRGMVSGRDTTRKADSAVTAEISRLP